LSNNTLSFEQAISSFLKTDEAKVFRGIKHGVEREALRIYPNGHLSTNAHPKGLGSALTHESITTDFSEALLEFITPPEADVNLTLAQLADIHKFTLGEMQDESLWPMSMPCYVDSETEIPIANYGTSNVGRMKATYRVGLKNRYGAMMQAIAGIHFNFSLPEQFWQSWAELQSVEHSQDFVSQQYFNLIRNYRRWCWLIPFLYGASPALCSSFLKGKSHNLPFETLGKGTLYLPYATSLRMSDLGYTNSQQSALRICYNKLPSYVESVRNAIHTHAEEYEQFSAGKNGKYEQLNSNILQIENELYSPIRPKQPTRSMEKPTDALEERGVSYIEVRALDVNPFADVGIEATQFYFLDAFLITCLLTPSPDLNAEEFAQTEANLTNTVLNGRDPEATLARRSDTIENEFEQVSLRDWAESLFAQFEQVANVLDQAHGNNNYSSAVAAELAKVKNTELTPSAKILAQLKNSGKDNSALGLELSKYYKKCFETQTYKVYSKSSLQNASEYSVQAQREIEAKDDKDFDVFLRDYFAS
jgi:glutamate--cysteine ligase